MSQLPVTACHSKQNYFPAGTIADNVSRYCRYFADKGHIAKLNVGQFAFALQIVRRACQVVELRQAADSAVRLNNYNQI